jgi:serine protease Do
MLKIDAQNLPTIKRVPLRYKVDTGEIVYCIGCTPDKKGCTINQGIISALERGYGRFVQIDARLNYGNVGGALVSINGRLLGITCRISNIPRIAGRIGQNSGIGFAVVYPKLRRIIKELKEGKKVAKNIRPIIGIVCDDAKGGGVLIVRVAKDTPAHKGGLKEGDIIIEFDGKKVGDFADLRYLIMKKKPGDRVKIIVKRGKAGRRKAVWLTLAEREDE